MARTLPIFRRLADSESPTSFANKLRSRRFHLFESLVARLPRPVRLLDGGGTNVFWERRGWAGRPEFEITTINVGAEEKRHENLEPLAGDATDLSRFEDCSFDVVFSNSVIEHLFTLENQRRMAAEVQWVGKAYWVQTPNFWFPMEPHFHIVGWQWLPESVRISMLVKKRCGWAGPYEDRETARKIVEEVRLMKAHELRALFPRAKLVAERFCGFAKPWTAINGFAGSAFNN